MNHISKSFVSDDGRVYKCHSWEQREGGYRRAALLVGNGAWSPQKETRLISFLLDRGFRVLSLEAAFGSPESPRLRLRSFRHAIESFARSGISRGLPLYLVASSFSAGALLPWAQGIEGIAALALISPIVELPPPKIRMPWFFFSTAELSVGPHERSGSPELLEGFATAPAPLRFHKRDLKAAAADIGAALAKPLGLPSAAFAGEDDPYLSSDGRSALARAGAKVYAYPRVKHEPAHDRYADNFYADLGSFLDEVEAGRTT